MPTDNAARRASIGLGRRGLLGVAGAALLAAFAVGLWSFAWPSAEARGEYAIGPIDAFPLGSVTSYLLVDGQLRELPLGEDYDQRPPGYPTLGADLVYIVRLPDEQLRVFSGAAPFRGSTIVWYQFDDLGGMLGEFVGLFAEGRRGTRWAIDGTRLFGPAPRNLDQYAFRVRADGVLVVNLADLREGAGGPFPTAPFYDVTSDDWPTSGWPPAR